jgi:Arc/MetJ-type ribon-helix-helix transcriptional regulator
MKLSVSLPDEDVEFLDRFARERGLGSRSAAVQRAVDVLRTAELAPAYRDAWDEWASGDAAVWEATTGDGAADDRA